MSVLIIFIEFAGTITFSTEYRSKPPESFVPCAAVMAELLNLKNLIFIFFFNRKTSGSTSKASLCLFYNTLIALFGFITSIIELHSNRNPSRVVETIVSIETHTVHKMIKTADKKQNFHS